MLRQILPRLGVVAIALPFFCLGSAALLSAGRGAGRSGEQMRLVVWGLPSGEETRGLDAQLREFERRNPGIRVVNLSVGSMDFQAQKLMTSTVGNTPPDLVRQDRFTIGDWASRETVEPLDGLLARERPDDPER